MDPEWQKKLWIKYLFRFLVRRKTDVALAWVYANKLWCCIREILMFNRGLVKGQRLACSFEIIILTIFRLTLTVNNIRTCKRLNCKKDFSGFRPFSIFLKITCSSIAVRLTKSYQKLNYISWRIIIIKIIAEMFR